MQLVKYGYILEDKNLHKLLDITKSKGNNIVALMNFIKNSINNEPLSQRPMVLQHKTLKENVILCVVDGMGFNYIKNNPDLKFLNSALVGSMHSLFPSSTAPGITAYLSGVAPINHGVFGWFQWLEQPSVMCTPLPFRSKATNKRLGDDGINIESCFNIPSFFESIQCKSYSYSPHFISNEVFNVYVTRGSERIGYESYDDLMAHFSKAYKKREGQRYHFIYFPFFDSSCHENGLNSTKTHEVALQLDQFLSELSGFISHDDTSLMITADHGMIDIPPENKLSIKDFPQLTALMYKPLSGEPRVRYCFVEENNKAQFKHEFNKSLSQYAYLFESSELLEQGWFGTSDSISKPPHALGDFTIIMKDNFTLTEGLDDSCFISMHGGTHEDEILIPLALVP